MDKIQNFKDKARVFRMLLATHDWKDTDAELLLRWRAPLFDDIEAGKVQPPQYYKYRLALGKDNPSYELDFPFVEAETQFISALEDWESQAWYQETIKCAKDNGGKN